MKFLAKINRNYLILFTAVLFISSMAGYFALRQVILEATKESLVEKKKLIIAQIKETGEIPNLYPIVEVKKLNRVTGNKSGFRQIMIQNEEEDEAEPYLEYAEEIKIGNAYYSLKLRQSSFENEDLIIIITLYFFIIISVSLGISFFISRKMNRTTWAEFEANLETIENFNFSGNSKIKLVKSNIEESDFSLKIHEQLADLLLNNLLSNAINHNLDGGSIQLVIAQNILKICNTGNPNNLSGETAFHRFTKGDSRSFGLGLAIVKKICDTNNLEICYKKNDRHCFTIIPGI